MGNEGDYAELAMDRRQTDVNAQFVESIYREISQLKRDGAILEVRMNALEGRLHELVAGMKDSQVKSDEILNTLHLHIVQDQQDKIRMQRMLIGNLVAVLITAFMSGAAYILDLPSLVSAIK